MIINLSLGVSSLSLENSVVWWNSRCVFGDTAGLTELGQKLEEAQELVVRNIAAAGTQYNAQIDKHHSCFKWHTTVQLVQAVNY